MINVRTTTQQDKKVSYPKLMKSKNSNLIVLFINQFTGTVLTDPLEHWDQIGYTSSWNINDFEEYTGTLTLSNQ